MASAHEPSESFQGLGISPSFLEVLTKLGFTKPTPIQFRAIPIAIQGKDLIGVAQTGTGKTLAFGIPMIQRIAQLKGTGLIILPTRELALQVDEVLHKIGSSLGLRTAVLIGGAPQDRQVKSLHKKPHIIVATPGRLLDHVDQHRINLKNMTIIVLDEADRMLDMGFAPQINKVLQGLPKERQMMLFSATMPPEIVKLGFRHMQLPLQIEIARTGSVASQIDQELFVIKKEDKMRLLDTLLGRYRGTILVFSRTKHGARKICRAINAIGGRAAEIHSNRSLNQRREALDGFKKGKYRILVATDIAARGIDVKDIELVINYDVPEDPEDYVHRIGRTGRAESAGKAVTFVTPDQRSKVRDIERLTRATLKFAELPELAAARPMSQARPDYERVSFHDKGRREGGQRRGSPRRGFGGGSPSHHGSSRRGPRRGHPKRRGFGGQL